MSIYGGFSTRKIEHVYNTTLFNTIYLLQLRICKIFAGEKFDDIKFGKLLTKLYARLYSMEEFKYLPPKFSSSLKDLTSYLGIFEISENDLKAKRGQQSDTSNSSVYQPKIELEIVQEKDVDHSDNDADKPQRSPSTIGERVKIAVHKYIFRNKRSEQR